MSTYTNARDWARAFEQSLNKQQHTVTSSHKELVVAVYQDYRRLLSGTISEKELRRAGHPFGRFSHPEGRGMMRGPRNGAEVSAARKKGIRRRYPIYPINKQTRKLLQGLQIKRTNVPGRIQAFDIFSDAPYAKYVLYPLGTDKMVGRNITTGHAIGKKAPGMVERHWRAKNRIIRTYFGK